jgi:hypothetical protein
MEKTEASGRLQTSAERRDKQFGDSVTKKIYCLLLVALIAGCAVQPSDQSLPAYVASSPTRTIAEIQHTFKRDEEQFKNLFINKKAKDGKIYVAFTIEPDGSVSESHAIESSFPPAISEAVLTLVRGMRFGARRVPSYFMPDYPITYQTP